MRQVQILAVLYDMSLAIGGELTVRPLFTRALQRFLVHTSLSAGLVLEVVEGRAVLARAIGDLRLAALEGQAVPVPATWVAGPAAGMRRGEGFPDEVALFDGHGFALRLPVPGLGAVVLLGPASYTTELPLAEIFQPVVANLAKAYLLCRANEAHAARLEEDRAEAQQRLQRSQEKIRRSEADLRRAQALSRTGSWTLDLASGRVEASEEARRIYGVAGDAELTVNDLNRVVHPDDQEERAAALTAMIDGAPYVRQQRFLVGGQTRWVRSRIELERGPDGEYARGYGVVQDVTEQVEMARALDRREKIFGAIAEHAELAMVVIDPRSGAFVEFNDAACNGLGYTREEFAGLGARDIQDAHSDERIAENRRAALERGGIDFENRHRGKDGSIRDVWVTMKRLRLPDADYIAVLWVDVTEQKRAEALVQKLSLAVEQSPEAVAITDTGARIEFVNDAFLRSTGYTREEVMGQNPRILQSGKTPRAVFEEMWATLDRGETWRGELSNRRKNGEELLEHAIISPLRQPDGKVTHYVAIKREITETRRMEVELSQHRHHLEELVQQRSDELRAIFRALPDLYFRIDGDGVILDYLTSQTSSLYVPPSVFMGKRVTEVLPPDIAAKLQDGLDRLARGDRIVDVEYELEMPGGLRAYEARMLPIGTGQQAVAVIRDVTERQKADQALAAARDAAEAGSRAKSAFLANMSHEIRTPMNAIIGLTHLARNEATSPRQEARLDKVLGAAHHLLSLINDVLDLSKIEAGKLSLESTELEVAAVFADIHDVIAEPARAKGLDLTVDVASLPARLRGDGLRLRQVILNFCSNAVKFTTEGGIRVHGRVVSGDRDVTLVRVQVTDTGIGLTAEERGRIFQSFQQADISTTRRYGGTGLGLAIARRIAQLMGGEVGCESEPGRGSTFWIEAPFGTVDAAVPAAPDAAGPADPASECAARSRRCPLRVLLAEDNELNREVATELLAAVGIRVDAAGDGLEAIARARAARYDLILMDLQMPGLNGFETTPQIRALAAYEQVPIVAMTANAFDEDREACLLAGMNDHVAKPVEPTLLYRTLLRWWPADGRAARSPLPPTRGAPPGAAPSSAPRPSPPILDQLDALPGLDSRRALRMLGGDQGLLIRLLDRFRHVHRDDGDRVVALLEAGDPGAAGQVAHALRGVAGTLGVVEVESIARALDVSLKQCAARGPGDPRRRPDAETRAGAEALVRALRRIAADLDGVLPAPVSASREASRIDWARLSAGLAHLAVLLERFDGAAEDQLEELLDALPDALGARAAELADRIASFDYPAALAVLHAAVEAEPRLAVS